MTDVTRPSSAESDAPVRLEKVRAVLEKIDAYTSVLSADGTLTGDQFRELCIQIAGDIDLIHTYVTTPDVGATDEGTGEGTTRH